MTLHPHLTASSKMRVVAIESTNSIHFVNDVLRAYKSGTVVLVCPPGRPEAESLCDVEIVEKLAPERSHGWHSFKFTPVESDDPAHITFTSGTTGAPKGIVLSHNALRDVVERLNIAMELGPEAREYVGVPVNYSFGFGRCRAIAAVGGACFLPATGFNPIELTDMIRGGDVNAISAVPTQWRALFKAAHLIGPSGANVRWIEIGSQPMARDEKERLKKLFPNALILQHYGLTEASRTTFLDITRASGAELDSVGRVIGETEIDIADDNRIRIRGPHVALGELREGAIRPIVDEHGWLRTNDLGSIRDGFLFYGGRSDDLINCGGTKVPSEAFEKALLRELGSEDGVAVGPAADEMRGQIILVVADDNSPHRQGQVEAAARSVASRFGLPDAGALRFARCVEIPRTATGKVRRQELASVAEAAPGPAVGGPSVAESSSQDGPSAETGDTKGQLIAVWRSVLGMETVPTDKSFFDLGGDSLSAMAVMIQIERLKVPAEIARKVFEGKTIQQIVDESEGREASIFGAQRATILGSRVINTLRGLLVLHVILIHWLPGIWARLPRMFSGMDHYLHPWYRLGTPGFALVFGLGWGYFQIPLYRSNPGRFLAIARRNAALLLGGILLFGSTRAAAILLSPGAHVLPGVFVTASYSVLAYYFFIVLASPIVLWPLARASNAVIASLQMSVLAFAAAIFATTLVSDVQGSGIAELIRLMLIAKYNIFGMSAIVLLGTSLGAAYRRAADSDALGRLPLVGLGACISGFGLVTSYRATGLSSWLGVHGQEPWALMTYTGVVMILWGCIQKALSARSLPCLARKALDGLAIIGVLALPAFVLHEAVIPAKDILVGVGAPGLLALAIPLAVFFAIMGFLYTRLGRLYLSSATNVP